MERLLIEIDRDDVISAWRTLEEIQHSAMLPPEVIFNLAKIIKDKWATTPLPLDLPIDYLRHTPGRRTGLPVLRSLKNHREVPLRFPKDLVLPGTVGNANDFGFIHDVLGRPEFAGPTPNLKVRLIVQLSDAVESTRLAEVLAQWKPDPTQLPLLSLAIFGPPGLLPGPLPIQAAWYDGPLWRLDRAAQIALLTTDVDVLLFLPIQAFADSITIERVQRYMALSTNLCLVLRTLDDPGLINKAVNVLTESPLQAAWKGKHTAFRSVSRLAFVVSARRFAAIGGFDPRFETEFYACRELGFRLYNSGVYFIPLALRTIDPFSIDRPSTQADRTLLTSLVPHSWDRKDDGCFEVPKVSIYVPAYRAAKYLREAIDSVLEQDFQDLEICVADDGSPDGTQQVLEEYVQEPRLRWETGINGGIGHASNRAIRMSRGIYVGQLDADDRLKPGAIRRLASFLDENPLVGCAYGSCERIGPTGDYIRNEYSWPSFSREKMMLTSITHHFRMFRRQAWERTGGFREDIVNGVDYDIFLKMSEVTAFQHVEETLYQRRWHGENTSHIDEAFQTANTHRVQREALKRLGLNKHWDLHVPDPTKPREITYQRNGSQHRVFFWPDYSRSNPYQRLLYRRSQDQCEILSGDIDAALGAIRQVTPERSSGVTFHLHWLNKVTIGTTSLGEASDKAQAFLAKLRQFTFCGGRLIWTIHNTASHDLPFPRVERNLAREIIGLSDAVHIHYAESVPEVETYFSVPRHKVHIHRHGAYIGSYPDFVSRDQARQELGLGTNDEVMLFIGQVRPYKGVDTLLAAFLEVAPKRPHLRLILAGSGSVNLLQDSIDPALRSRIHLFNRFIDDMEIQLFMRAADFSVFPYRSILTSGSLLLSLSFGLPTVVPSYGMMRSTLGEDASETNVSGVQYSPEQGTQPLVRALCEMLSRIDAGEGPKMAAAARARAEDQTWDDITPMLLGGLS